MRLWCKLCGGWFGRHDSLLHELASTLDDIEWEVHVEGALGIANGGGEEEQ